LKPIIPAPEDDAVSTDGGADEQSDKSEESPLSNEQRQQEDERRQQQEIRRREMEAKRKDDAAIRKVESERLAAQTAEERKRREEQRRKEEQAAETKRKQQEKKERERAKKAEEQQKKAVEQELQKREQQREEARRKALEQAERDKAAAIAEETNREEQHVLQLFNEDRLERLEELKNLSDEDIVTGLQAAIDTNTPLRGALYLLKHADVSDEHRLDCLMTLISFAGSVWQLGLGPPPELTLPSATRTAAKKARPRLREIAMRWFDGLSQDNGADDVDAVTGYERGMVQGLYEWRVWSLSEREAELQARGEMKTTTEKTESKVIEAKTPSPKKGKNNSKAAKEQPEENLDSLFAEFGVTIEEKRKSKKGRK